MLMSVLKSGAVGLTAGIFIGSIITWNIQGAKIDILMAEGRILKANINTTVERNKKELAIKEKQFNEVLVKSTSEWKKQESAYISTLNRLQHDRDTYRSSLLSRIAESSRNPNELCFSRDKFESAIRQLDESLSGIVGQCLDTETRLNITKNWYNSIRKIK